MDKKEQARLLIEIMEADARDGLYESSVPVPGKTQTAVEWMALRYHHRQGYLSQEDINQAKKMEAEQLLIKYGEGYDEGLYDALNK